MATKGRNQVVVTERSDQSQSFQEKELSVEDGKRLIDFFALLLEWDIEEKKNKAISLKRERAALLQPPIEKVLS